MKEKLRKTSIDIVGDVPWGTHFCQFYETKKDLIEILVPYFKMGLENNEFCMWITSEPLSAKEAAEALKKEACNLDDYIKRGQIEILDYSQWYMKPGYFDSEQVLRGWVEKEKEALRNGFDGLRLTGNTMWLEKKDYRGFTEYEVAINSVIGNFRMLAICTYSLDKCGTSEVMDVVGTHQFALIKRHGKWEIVQNAEHKKIAESLRHSEERYALAQRATNIGRWEWNIRTGELVWSEQIEPMFGFGRGEFGATYQAFLECAHSEDRHRVVYAVNACVQEGKDYAIEHRIVWPDKTVRWVSQIGNVVRDEKGRAIRMLGVVQDITERKDAESRQQLAGHILECLNREKMEMDVVRDVLTLVRKFTGFEAIGIRLHQGDDFPYFETQGFPEDFVKAENYLCARTENGELIYDSQGAALLECMCGNVISGRTDPTLPFFTEGGSFWTNTTTQLLNSTPPSDLQAHTRNRCNQAGYESVALIPLRSDRHIVGLLQFNDTRPGRFTREMIRFFEDIGVSIGVALARIRAEQDLEKYRQHLEELVQARTEDLTRANEQLLQEIEQRGRLERELFAISETEQTRIGQELHDSLGQQLVGIALTTKVLEQKLNSKSLAESADAKEIGKLVNRAMEMTRGLAKGLHPVDLSTGGLILALQEFAATTKHLFGICCTFECDTPVRMDDAAVAVHLYRIAQETVTNAIKHGKAKNIHIELTCGRDKSVLRVKSDGLDFPGMQVKGTGMGLQIMDHRAEMIGGSLDIRRGDEGGTIVVCAFPSKNPDKSVEQDYGAKKTTR